MDRIHKLRTMISIYCLSFSHKFHVHYTNAYVNRKNTHTYTCHLTCLYISRIGIIYFITIIIMWQQRSSQHSNTCEQWKQMGSNHIFAIYMISLSCFSVVDKQRWQLKAIFPLCVAIFQNYNQEKSLMAHLLFFSLCLFFHQWIRVFQPTHFHQIFIIRNAENFAVSILFFHKKEQRWQKYFIIYQNSIIEYRFRYSPVLLYLCSNANHTSFTCVSL